jgi:hypothetical protein
MFAVSALAQGPSGIWTAWPFIQNMDTTEATCVIDFYQEDATGTTPFHQITNFTVPGSTSKLIPVNTTNALGTFSGSMVVSCDKQVAAVTNVVNDQGAGSSYVGASVGDNTVSVPSVHAADYGWYTEISVQNVGTTDAVVTVAFKHSERGADYTPAAVTIKPGSVHRFDTSDYVVNLDNNASADLGFVGGATVTSTGGAIAVVAREWNSGSGVMTIGYNGIPATDGGTSVYFPSQHNNNYDWNTWNFVFNSWDTAATVSIKFTGKAAVTRTIPANGSITIATGDFLGAQDFVGALEVTCTNCPAGTKYLSGIANEVNGVSKGALSYNGFYEGAETLIFPSQHNNNWGWNAYNFVQNLDPDTAAAVTVEWIAAGDSVSAAPAPFNTTIPAGGKLELHTYAYHGGNDFVGALKVSTTNATEIVAISNEVNGNVSGLDASLSRGALSE